MSSSRQSSNLRKDWPRLHITFSDCRKVYKPTATTFNQESVLPGTPVATARPFFAHHSACSMTIRCLDCTSWVMHQMAHPADNSRSAVQVCVRMDLAILAI